jgi:hypothetical protein
MNNGSYNNAQLGLNSPGVKECVPGKDKRQLFLSLQTERMDEERKSLN